MLDGYQGVAAFATSPSGDEALGDALRVLLGRRIDPSGPDASSVFSAQHNGSSLPNAAEVSVPLRRNRASRFLLCALCVLCGLNPNGLERRTGRDLPQRTQGTQRFGRTGSPSQVPPIPRRAKKTGEAYSWESVTAFLRNGLSVLKEASFHRFGKTGPFSLSSLRSLRSLWPKSKRT